MERAGGSRFAPAVAVEIVLVALASALGYVVLHRAARHLFLNGLPADPNAFPRPGADLVAAAESLQTYWLATAAVLVLFGWVLVRSRSAAWRRVAWLPVALGALGHLVALPARPGESIDLLSYLSHGYLAATAGGNPYVSASADVALTDYGPALLSEGWMPVHPQTPYGPVWTHLERLAYLAGGEEVSVSLLVLKAVAVLASLGSAALVWLIARRLRPGWELPATLAYLANPVVVVEFAIGGHNDALAVTFTLLGLWAAITGRAFLAVVGLGLGVLTKFTPAAFALPALVLLVDRRRSWPSLIGQLAAGLGVVAALAALLYRPWWVGSATFEGLRASSRPLPSWAPANALNGWLQASSGDVDDPRLGLALAGLLLAAVLAFSWRRTDGGFLTGCAAIAVAALALSPNYWPWYSALPIAVLVARTGWAPVLQLFALTVGSRIAAPFGDLFTLGLVPFDRALQLSSLWGLVLPVLIWVVIAAVTFEGRLRELDN